jgi:hypothetical protein
LEVSVPENEEHSQESERLVLRVGSLDLKSAAKQPRSTGSGRREYQVRFIRAGRVRAQGNTPSNIEIPAEPIQEALAAGKFVGLAVFLDHSGWFEYPSLKNLAGVTVSAEWNAAEQSADGVIRFYESPAANIASICWTACWPTRRRGLQFLILVFRWCSGPGGRLEIMTRILESWRK